uniref:Uncharacterized protein n=1 Tax=Anguilla anguilla TaxID=7936 RepID=A0A0E9QH61_ANGAN
MKSRENVCHVFPFLFFHCFTCGINMVWRVLGFAEISFYNR